MMCRRNRDTARGYTLIELLVSLTTAMALVGGLMTVLFRSQVAQESQMDLVDLRQQARVVLKEISDEVRMAGYDLGSAPERLTWAATSRISFVADIDDGSGDAPCDLADETAVDGGAERVTYRLQGTDLLRTVDCWDGAAWGNEYTDVPVAREVQNFRALFRYFAEDGTELLPGAGTLNAADRDSVFSVQIQLDLLGADNQAVGETNVDFQLETLVRLRNAGS